MLTTTSESNDEILRWIVNPLWSCKGDRQMLISDYDKEQPERQADDWVEGLLHLTAGGAWRFDAWQLQSGRLTGLNTPAHFSAFEGTFCVGQYPASNEAAQQPHSQYPPGERRPCPTTTGRRQLVVSPRRRGYADSALAAAGATYPTIPPVPIQRRMLPLPPLPLPRDLVRSI